MMDDDEIVARGCTALWERAAFETNPSNYRDRWQQFIPCNKVALWWRHTFSKIMLHYVINVIAPQVSSTILIQAKSDIAIQRLINLQWNTAFVVNQATDSTKWRFKIFLFAKLTGRGEPTLTLQHCVRLLLNLRGYRSGYVILKIWIAFSLEF